MTRERFLGELGGRLRWRLSEQKAQEVLADYREYFEEGLAEGRSEQELFAEFGTPQDIASALAAQKADARFWDAPNRRKLCFAVLLALTAAAMTFLPGFATAPVCVFFILLPAFSPVLRWGAHAQPAASRGVRWPVTAALVLGALCSVLIILSLVPLWTGDLERILNLPLPAARLYGAVVAICRICAVVSLAALLLYENGAVRRLGFSLWHALIFSSVCVLEGWLRRLTSLDELQMLFAELMRNALIGLAAAAAVSAARYFWQRARKERVKWTAR